MGWWGAAGRRQGGGVTNHVPQCHQSLGNDSLGVCLVFQHLSNATGEIGGEDSFYESVASRTSIISSPTCTAVSSLHCGLSKWISLLKL